MFAAIFRQWLGVVERNLEPQEHFRLVPELRNVTTAGTQGGEGACSSLRT